MPLSVYAVVEPAGLYVPISRSLRFALRFELQRRDRNSLVSQVLILQATCHQPPPSFSAKLPPAGVRPPVEKSVWVVSHP